MCSCSFCWQFDMGDVLIDGQTTGKNYWNFGCFLGLWSMKLFFPGHVGFSLLLVFVAVPVAFTSSIVIQTCLFQDFVPEDVQQLQILEHLCWQAQRCVPLLTCRFKAVWYTWFWCLKHTCYTEFLFLLCSWMCMFVYCLFFSFFVTCHLPYGLT